MNLLAQRQIHYIVPPAYEAQTAIEEIAGLDAKETLDDAQSARRAELIASLPPVTEYRITVGRASVLQLGRYNVKFRQMAKEWFEAETGFKVADVLASFSTDKETEGQGDKETEEETPTRDRQTVDLSLINLMNQAYAWASIVTALQRIEVRERPLFEEKGKWRECEIPEAWKTPGGFFASVDPDLMHEMEIHVSACNVGIFRVDMSDIAKKTGVIAVR